MICDNLMKKLLVSPSKHSISFITSVFYYFDGLTFSILLNLKKISFLLPNHMQWLNLAVFHWLLI